MLLLTVVAIIYQTATLFLWNVQFWHPRRMHLWVDHTQGTCITSRLINFQVIFGLTSIWWDTVRLLVHFGWRLADRLLEHLVTVDSFKVSSLALCPETLLNAWGVYGLINIAEKHFSWLRGLSVELKSIESHWRLLLWLKNWGVLPIERLCSVATNEGLSCYRFRLQAVLLVQFVLFLLNRVLDLVIFVHYSLSFRWNEWTSLLDRSSTISRLLLWLTD